MHPSTDGDTGTVTTATATHALITRIQYGFKRHVYPVGEHTTASQTDTGLGSHSLRSLEEITHTLAIVLVAT